MKTLKERLDEAIENGEISDQEAREIFRSEEANERDRQEWEDRGGMR